MIFRSFPILIPIIALEFITIAVYNTEGLHGKTLHIWWGAQGLGTCMYGLISDFHCRRRMILILHVMAAISICVVLWYGWSLWSVAFLGFCLSPNSVVRAAFVDNFPHRSIILVLAPTFFVEFSPWIFSGFLKQIPDHMVLIPALVLIVLNFPFVFSFFRDSKDRLQARRHSSISPFSRVNRKKILFFLSAFLLAELVFFIADAFLEGTHGGEGYLSILGIGTTLGLCVGIFLHSKSHALVVAVSYLIGFLISLTALFSIIVSPAGSCGLYLIFAVISTLGGLYMPFVYDIVITRSGADHRGLACSLIDFCVYLSAIIGVSLVGSLDLTVIGALVTISFLYLGAFLLVVFDLRRKIEKRET